MLNNDFFGKKDDSYILGDNCHRQSEGDIAVWVVTDILGNILFGNSITYSEEGKIDVAEPNEWALTKGRITENRFFQAANATIAISCPLLDSDENYPELPKHVARHLKEPITLQTTVSQNNQIQQNGSSTTTLPTTSPTINVPSKVGPLLNDEGKPYAPLDKNDEICIWCGYIERLRPVTKDDFKKGHLIRKFVGVIDTIVESSTATQGVNVVIQCRDRMRYLMDSMGTFNTTDFNPFDKEYPKGTNEAGSKQITRDSVILELARRCLGDLRGAESISSELRTVCGTIGGFIINRGYIVDWSNAPPSGSISPIYSSKNKDNVPYGNTDITKIPFIGGSTRTPPPVNKLPNSSDYALDATELKFNIITGRTPYQLQESQTNFLGNAHQITDRVPAEYIKFLSLQEPWPTEFFCDARTGEYWYAPRGVDVSGLDDPKRLFRTYCVRRAPKDLLNTISPGTVTEKHFPNQIHPGQAALLFREESSSINWRSNIIVSSQPTGAADGNSTAVHIQVNPYWMEKRRFACSFFQAVDSTIGNNAAELVSTAMSYARLYGKELRGATLHVIGDPSLTPGEGIQVIGNVLYGGGFNTRKDKKQDWLWDREVLIDFITGYEELSKNQLESIKKSTNDENSGKNRPYVGTGTLDSPQKRKDAISKQLYGQNVVKGESLQNLSQANLMCPAMFGSNAGSPTNSVAGGGITSGGGTTHSSAKSNPNLYGAPPIDPVDPNKIYSSSPPSKIDPNKVYSSSGPQSTTTNPQDPPLQVTPNTKNAVDFPEDPRTMWRIEAVVHKFNENPGVGYRSEIALLAPF